jgi:hypothetical protein
VVEKVYESNPQALLPTNLTGHPVTSSRNRRAPNLNHPYVYPPGPFPGWPPYPVPSAPVPYPPYTLPGPSNPLFYPPYLTDNSINSPAEGDHGSPGNSDEDLHYPTIAEFFTELMETESSEHYFTSYTDGFHDNGYYRINELVDEDLTVGHMVNIVDHLKEGTARVIKRKASDKVRRIRKGKGKAKK